MDPANPMRMMLSTEGFDPADSFKLWREVINETVTPIKLTRADPTPFKATLGLVEVGSVPIVHFSSSANTIEATQETVKRHSWPDALRVVIAAAGGIDGTQSGRKYRQRSGDIVLLDAKPHIQDVHDGCESIVLYIPRERIERLLGPASIYAATVVAGDRPAAMLARSFIVELTCLHQAMTSDMAERMVNIAADLLVASLSERMAEEVPGELRGAVAVQQANAYIGAHFSNPKLMPADVAVAVGISLRRLQQLFQERERSIADCIWERRLEVAAQRLADPGQLSLLISTLGYACGFSSQAHFSNRFKNRYGLSPQEYRDVAVDKRDQVQARRSARKLH